jgi:ubiquinone/menaquinone biosynthesis C-methylase UbiE
MSDTASSTPKFVPALGVDWLTPLYDTVAWLMGERALKRRLIAQAAIEPGQAVLDVGSGTGTLLMLAHEAAPGARLSGVDIDPRIIAIARAKLAAAGIPAEIVQGSATAPPLPPASFDRVLTTLVLHHLTTAQKGEAFAAIRRLLKPGGELHVADWGKPQNLLMEIAALSFRYFDGDETTGANLRGELPAMMRTAGFVDVREVEHRMTPLGTLAYLRATAP